MIWLGNSIKLQAKPTEARNKHSLIQIRSSYLQWPSQAALKLAEGYACFIDQIDVHFQRDYSHMKGVLKSGLYP